MRRPVRKRIKQRQAKFVGQKETAGDRAKRTAVKFIRDHSEFPMMLCALREGQPPKSIAEHLIDRGLVAINMKTMIGYLQYFRKANPVLCRPQALTPQLNNEGNYIEGSLPGYDHLFDGHAAIVDEETEILRLIQLQKSRLGLGYQSERNMGLLMQHTVKDVQALGDLLEKLAKLRGKVGSRVDMNVHHYDERVKGDLKAIEQDENQREMLANMVAELQGVYDEA